MTLYGVLFYLLAGAIAAATGLALTRRDPLHAVLWLILSFFGSALLFYLLGAPMLAALEVIVYAGAVMILFLFIVMMLKGSAAPARRPSPLRLAPLGVLAAAGLLLGAGMLRHGGETLLPLALLSPGDLGLHLFRRHALAVEIVSLLLLVALVGALLLDRPAARRPGSAP
jgi:NADH-quinone oxidoreductase subunit J